MQHRHAIYILTGIVIAVIAGIGSGWFFGPQMSAVKWVGDLFLDALKMLIIPLIFAAVISGVASLGDIRKLGRLGGTTVAYYVITTGIGVLIGLIVVNVLAPGAGLAIDTAQPIEDIAAREAGIVDILRSLIHPNIVAAAAEAQFLPLILFAILFAAALTTVGKVGEHVLEFFNGVNEAMMRLVIWLMYLAPIGIFALIAGRLGEAGGGAAFVAELQGVGMYVVTVLTGLALHFIVLMIILVIVAGQPPAYLTGMLRALFTAFGTASSTATLPLTMECARENGIDPRAGRFVLPLGSTVNMNGTALYEAVAAMFIAQAYGLDLGIGQQAIIFITATLAAVGAAGIPEAGLVMMVIVLKSVGLPLDGIGLILSVDWFLDRFRTAVNVWGDAVGAAVVNRLVPGFRGSVASELAPSAAS